MLSPLPILLGVALFWLAHPSAALAQQAGPGDPTYTVPRYSSIVVDAASGKVLSAIDADSPRYPASLTKLMTLYMVFEALRDHRVSLDQLVPVSAHAASMEPSKLGLVPGSRMTVEEGILGIVTKSANDDAAALGELLGGDESRFAEMMTLRARALGMSRTTFRNASGLPDPYQVTTARDLGILARHLLQDFPNEYHYFSVPSFVFHRRTIFNHDHMLISYPGADGMKTGYTRAAGCNLITSALHGNVRLVGVVLGAHSNAARDVQMASLLNAGFTEEGAPDIGPDQTARMRFASLRHRFGRLSLISRAEAATLPEHGRASGTTHGKPTLMPSLAHYSPAGWSVQFGTFSSAAAARRLANTARSGASGGSVRVSESGKGRHHLWRVQLTGLTEQQAHGACSASAHEHANCMLIHPIRQMASR
jgi:D-alanyl-D-alanine carboxypeptidase